MLVKEQNNLSNLCNFQIHEKLFKEKRQQPSKTAKLLGGKQVHYLV